MATEYKIIKVRRDTAADWTSNNPVLNEGEWGYETDTGSTKIGDGSTNWNSLKYTYDDVIYFDKTNNRVGIGTNSPDLPLHIYGGFPTVYIERNTGAGGASGLVFGNSTDNGYYVTGSDSNFTIGKITNITGTPSYAEKFRIDTNGNVGIGTTSPLWELHVEENTAGSTTTIAVRNDDNTNAASDAEIFVETGGASGGNPKVHLQVDGVTSWAMGIDNADSDGLKIGRSSDVGTNTVLTLTTGDNAFFEGELNAVLAGTTGGSDVRYNTGTGSIFYDTSALKYKENVQEATTEDVSWIYDLNVKKYDRKDGSRTGEIGLIADELQTIKPELCSYKIQNKAEIKQAKAHNKEVLDDEGQIKEGEELYTVPEPIQEIESYSKSDLVPYLIGVIQDLNERLKILENSTRSIK